MFQKGLFFLLVVFLTITDCLLAQQYSFNKDSLITAVLQDIKADSVRKTIQELQAFDTRFALAPSRKDVAVHILDKLTALGYTNAKLDSFKLDSVQWLPGSGNYYSTWQYNVIAQVDGVLDANKIFILGAHYDNAVYPGDAFATTPGADDNASGIAAMLETARVFKSHHIQPDYTIRFVAFAAEELNLCGSNDYAGKVGNAFEDIVLMINNDMIAHNKQAVNNCKLKIQKYPQTDWIVNLTEQIAQDYTALTVTLDSNAIAFSDSYLFNLWGYDAVFYQEFDFDTLLHTTFDIIDSLDMDYCAEMTKISCGMLLNTNLTLAGVETASKSDFISNIYPNPVTDIATLSINSNKEQKACIFIYDLNNRKVFEVEKSLKAQGINNFVLDMKPYTKGIYNCVIKTPQSFISHKVIKL